MSKPLGQRMMQVVVHDRSKPGHWSPIQFISRRRSEENCHAAAAFVGNCHVLDIGPGYGVGYEKLLAANPASVTCIDPFPAAAEQFIHRADPRVRFLTQDFLRNTLPDESIDTVICLAAIYYFPDPQPFFAQVRRVLKQGGVLVINQFDREVMRAWFGCELRDVDQRYGPMYSSAEFTSVLRREFGGEPDRYVQSPVRNGSRLKFVLSTASLPLRMMFMRPRVRRAVGTETGVYNFFVVQKTRRLSEPGADCPRNLDR